MACGYKSMPGPSPSQKVPLRPLQVCCKGFLTYCLFDALCGFWKQVGYWPWLLMSIPHHVSSVI